MMFQLIGGCYSGSYTKEGDYDSYVALEEAREVAEAESVAVALNIGTRAHSTS